MMSRAESIVEARKNSVTVSRLTAGLLGLDSDQDVARENILGRYGNGYMSGVPSKIRWARMQHSAVKKGTAFRVPGATRGRGRPKREKGTGFGDFDLPSDVIGQTRAEFENIPTSFKPLRLGR
jgi:hypothetical protein